jgi:hypothetical protein
MTNMLNTEVNTFLHVTISDDLMDDDADSIWGDVVHNSSTSSEIIIKRSNLFHNHRNTPMVIFVGHALLLRRVCFDINDISYMVVDEESRQLNGTMF